MLNRIYTKFSTINSHFARTKLGQLQYKGVMMSVYTLIIIKGSIRIISIIRFY